MRLAPVQATAVDRRPDARSVSASAESALDPMPAAGSDPSKGGEQSNFGSLAMPFESHDASQAVLGMPPNVPFEGTSE